jgi:hypothetical protein
LQRRDRRGIVAELELVERGLVDLVLRGRGPRLGGGRRDRRLLARLLQAPQARVQVDMQVLLPLLDGLELVQDHFDVPARARELPAQRLDLAGEVEDHAALHRGGLDRGEALLACLQLLLHVLDAAAHLRVGEQLRGGRARPGERRRRREPAHGAHQYSPW